MLAAHFVSKYNKSYKMDKKISNEAMSVLQEFDWPGNIRELENVIERIMISFDDNIITKAQVERAMGVMTESVGMDLSNLEGKTMTELMDEYEKYILESMLAKYKRASEVGRALGMNKSTLSRRMKKYGLER